MRVALIIFSFVALTLHGAVAPAAALSTEERIRLGAKIVSGHVVPGYARLKTEADTLKDEIEKSCAGGAPLTGKTVRGPYKDTLAAWMSVQHIRFGPAMNEDRFYRFQYWPDKHGQGGKQLRRALAGAIEKIPDLDRIAKTSVALQGFPALERLVFPSKPPSGEKVALQCKLARSIAHNLANMAGSALAEWNAYKPAAPETVVETLLRNTIEQLQIIADLKLTRPLGKSAKKARPRRAESWRSRWSFMAIKWNMVGLREILTGGEGTGGFASALPNQGETLNLGSSISEHLEYGIRVIDQYPSSLYDATRNEEGREFIRFLIAHTNGLRELLIGNVAPALGVNLGFNSQDGD